METDRVRLIKELSLVDEEFRTEYRKHLLIPSEFYERLCYSDLFDLPGCINYDRYVIRAGSQVEGATSCRLFIHDTLEEDQLIIDTVRGHGAGIGTFTRELFQHLTPISGCIGGYIFPGVNVLISECMREPTLVSGVVYSSPALTHTTVNSLSDISLAWKLDFWPSDAGEWIHRQRTWPPIPVVIDICQHPCYMVHKPSSPDPEHQDEMSLSFTYGEQAITLYRSSGMKLTYFAMKSIFYYIFNFKVATKEFGSYLAKTTMMWACEELPPDVWTEANLERNLCYLFSTLLDYLDQRMLPHYWMPGVNLLRNHPDELYDLMDTKLDKVRLRTDPLSCLPHNIPQVLEHMHIQLLFQFHFNDYVKRVMYNLDISLDNTATHPPHLIRWHNIISDNDPKNSIHNIFIYIVENYANGIISLSLKHHFMADIFPDAATFMKMLPKDPELTTWYFDALSGVSEGLQFYNKTIPSSKS